MAVSVRHFRTRISDILRNGRTTRQNAGASVRRDCRSFASPSHRDETIAAHRKTNCAARKIKKTKAIFFATRNSAGENAAIQNSGKTKTVVQSKIVVCGEIVLRDNPR